MKRYIVAFVYGRDQVQFLFADAKLNDGRFELYTMEQIRKMISFESKDKLGHTRMIDENVPTMRIIPVKLSKSKKFRIVFDKIRKQIEFLNLEKFSAYIKLLLNRANDNYHVEIPGDFNYIELR